MNNLLSVILGGVFSLGTGWFVVIVIAGIFCDGFQPNWLCSGHGGAIWWFAILSILISFPAFTYLFIVIDKKIMKNK